MTPMIYLVVRKTTDWENEATFRAQIPAGFSPMVELWDATFAMPYHLFRRELTRIAQLNWARVAGARCVARDEIPLGGLVVPTDDDDWFSPRLAATLAANLDPSSLVYRWPSRFIEVPINLGHRLGKIRRAIFPHVPPKWVCTTNNYALVMRPETAPLIGSHRAASRWVEAHPSDVMWLGEPLSVMNRTLASRTSLRSRPSRSALLRKRRRYARLYRRALAPELAWCEPYVAMMRDLMDALRVA
jgi:hypothetical protein